MKKALITGITGQDGSFLAEHLLEQGYEVHGVIRRIAMEDPGHRLWRIKHIKDKLVLHGLSLVDYVNISRLFSEFQFDECYHLASQSYVTYSFEDDFNDYNTNIAGTNYILTAIKEICPECKFYFAGSSEMFGNVESSPQNEKTTFYPRSFYGMSKVSGCYLTRNYRDSSNIFSCTGILYNHESERRGFEFVTRKISNAVAGIKLGLSHELRLGNIDNRRDWGYAADYVKAMWAILQHDTPSDFVIATGQTHTVREFVEKAFDFAGLNWKDFVIIDEKLCRPVEAVEFRGDFAKANSILGWSPTVYLDKLIEIMVSYDLERLKSQR